MTQMAKRHRGDGAASTFFEQSAQIVNARGFHKTRNANGKD
jgi:hypothetical protein